MMITHKLLPMDLAILGTTQWVNVVQDDQYSRNVEFTLTQNGAAWPIPDDATAVIRYKKPDGTGGNYDLLPDGTEAYRIDGNVLTVALAPQVCTAPGLVLLAVGLYHGAAEINTFSVNIAVHPNPGIDVISEDYSNLDLYNRLAKIETELENMAGAHWADWQESTEHPGHFYREVHDESPLTIEWLNPPMVEGVIYRTAARCIAGVPIYTCVYRNAEVFLGIYENGDRVKLPFPYAQFAAGGELNGTRPIMPKVCGTFTDVGSYISGGNETTFPVNYGNNAGDCIHIGATIEFGDNDALTNFVELQFSTPNDIDHSDNVYVSYVAEFGLYAM